MDGGNFVKTHISQLTALVHGFRSAPSPGIIGEKVLLFTLYNIYSSHITHTHTEATELDSGVSLGFRLALYIRSAIYIDMHH